MQRSLFVSLLLVLVSLAACSDDSTSPNNNNNGNGGGGDHPFEVVSVIRDSVFWGDTVTVTLRNATTDSYTLFVGSVPIAIDSVWRDTDSSSGIRFRAPDGLSSGTLRIYERDTVQAGGNKLLFVYAQNRRSVTRSVDLFSFEKVYRGDIILIRGREMPIRKEEIVVSVNGVPLTVESWDNFNIVARVTPGVQTGPLHVKLFDSVYTLPTLTILEHGGEFLKDITVRKLTITLVQFRGTSETLTIVNGDTTRTTGNAALLGTTTTGSYEERARELSRDSVHYTGENAGLWVELDVKLEPESRVSGVFTIRTEYEVFNELHFKNMRWVKENGKYVIRAIATDLQDQLLAYIERYMYGGGGQINTFNEFDIGSQVGLEFSAE